MHKCTSRETSINVKNCKYVSSDRPMIKFFLRILSFCICIDNVIRNQFESVTMPQIGMWSGNILFRLPPFNSVSSSVQSNFQYFADKMTNYSDINQKSNNPLDHSML